MRAAVATGQDDMEQASEAMATTQADTRGAIMGGLTEHEAAERRARGLGNSPPPPTGRTYWQILVENVFTFINMVIFALGFALVLLGRVGDALVSTGVILMNVLVSVVQEIRAKRTLDRIALLTRPVARVVRDGAERELSQQELVLGDVLRVEPGDQVVLDGTVIGEGALTVDESLLTGESDLVPKREGDLVYSGSFCVTGSGYYIAEKVGQQSFANQITAGARSFRRVLTPLQQQISLVIRIFLLIVLYLEFLAFLYGLQHRVGLVQGVQNSTIIASLIPSGLFLSMSVAYALAAVRIIRFGALVQQANAIESLSNVDVLCLDKTGTLTANRLHVDRIYPIGRGEDELRGLLGAMTASATNRNKTSDAILAACPGRGVAPVAEVAFSSTRKWSAVALGGAGANPRVPPGVYALGAPEALRPSLAPGVAWEPLEAQIAALADQGLRVLLAARHPDPSALVGRGEASELPSGMEPLGLVSLSDELRPEARETLKAFIRAGVQPKIISGDKPETVAALAKQAGLGPDIGLVSGPDLDAMDESAFAEAAATATIFGRTTPQHKERLIRALRGRGRYVAMIGDGVNDVLSLKQANLGVAMQSGSQAARGVADIVLMRDSFAALAPAVEEGQRIVNGMHDILGLFLARISTFGLLIVSSLVAGAFPLALRQGSVVTLFAVGIPAVLLAVWAQPGSRDRRDTQRQLVQFVLPAAIASSILGLLLFYGSLYLELGRNLTFNPVPADAQPLSVYAQELPEAQTMLAAFLVFCGLFLVIFVQPPNDWWAGGSPRSGDRRPTLLAVGLMAAFVVLDIIPPLGQLFALTPLAPAQLAAVAVLMAVWVFLVRWLWRSQALARFVGIGGGQRERGA